MTVFTWIIAVPWFAFAWLAIYEVRRLRTRLRKMKNAIETATRERDEAAKRHSGLTFYSRGLECELNAARAELLYAVRERDATSKVNTDLAAELNECWKAREAAAASLETLRIADEEAVRKAIRHHAALTRGTARIATLEKAKSRQYLKIAQNAVGAALDWLSGATIIQMNTKLKHNLPNTWAVHYRGQPKLETALRLLVHSMGKVWTGRQAFYVWQGGPEINLYVGTMLPGDIRPFLLEENAFLSYFAKPDFVPVKGSLVQVKHHENGSWMIRVYERKLNRQNGFVHRCHDGHTYKYVQAIEGLSTAVISPFPSPAAKFAISGSGTTLAIRQPVGEPIKGYNVTGGVPLDFKIDYKLDNGQPAIRMPQAPGNCGIPPMSATQFENFVNQGRTGGVDPMAQAREIAAQGQASLVSRTHAQDHGAPSAQHNYPSGADVRDHSINGLTAYEQAKCMELLQTIGEAQNRGMVAQTLILHPDETDKIVEYANLVRGNRPK